MTDAPRFRIQKFIAHVIDHRSSMLELSGAETPVDAAFPHELFDEYILHALGHSLRRHACFRGEDGTVRAAFRRILGEPLQFVAASREIAGHLYQVMSEGPFSGWISPGDIMVALVAETAAAGSAGSTWLAILKIDPSEAILRRVVQSPDGPQVIYQRREDRIPRVEEKGVQKIAVIYDRLRQEPEPHDLVLLDNQINESKVARFFYDSFLGARLNRDGREVAQVLHRRVKRFASKQALTPDELRAVVNTAEARLRQGGPVNAQDFAAEAARATGRNAAEVRKLEAALVKEITSYGKPEDRIAADEPLPVDGARAEALSKTRTYLLDGGIQVTGPTDEVEKRVKIAQSAGGKITVTIKSDTLEVV